MNESINICYTRLNSSADLDGFIAALTETLADEGSSPTITTQLVPTTALNGNTFRAVWTGDYSFQSPDGFYTFSETGLQTQVDSKKLNYDTLMALLAGRGKHIEHAYRNALRGIFNVAVNVRDGAHVPPSPMTGTEYVTAILEAGLAAFPNSV